MHFVLLLFGLSCLLNSKSKVFAYVHMNMNMFLFVCIVGFSDECYLIIGRPGWLVLRTPNGFDIVIDFDEFELYRWLFVV